MGYDIRVYSLLEIVHKNEGRYTLGAEYDEPLDAEPRTKLQRHIFRSRFSRFGFISGLPDSSI
jgi:hypothetical protein